MTAFVIRRRPWPDGFAGRPEKMWVLDRGGRAIGFYRTRRDAIFATEGIVWPSDTLMIEDERQGR